MGDSLPKIKLLGENHAVILPKICEREELLLAFGPASQSGGMPLIRVHTAMIGLCTRIGRKSGIDYFACNCSPLKYGGEVYSWLRSQSPPPSQEEIVLAGVEITKLLAASTFPRESEVREQTDFFGVSGEPTSFSPSGSV